MVFWMVQYGGLGVIRARAVDCLALGTALFGDSRLDSARVRNSRSYRHRKNTILLIMEVQSLQTDDLCCFML